MALSQVGNGVDDPDQNYPENYACGLRTYMDYCSKEFDALIAKQSAERDQEKRKLIAWEIDRKLTEDAVRPMIYYMRGGTCWQTGSEEFDDHGEQHLQWLAHGGSLGGPIAI
jgi:peptide/nickel transport system substrate-binding protein